MGQGPFCLLSAAFPSCPRGSPSIPMSHMHRSLTLPSILYGRALTILTTGIWDEEGLGMVSFFPLTKQSENIYTPSCWHALERRAPAAVLVAEKLFSFCSIRSSSSELRWWICLISLFLFIFSQQKRVELLGAVRRERGQRLKREEKWRGYQRRRPRRAANGISGWVRQQLAWARLLTPGTVHEPRRSSRRQAKRCSSHHGRPMLCGAPGNRLGKLNTYCNALEVAPFACTAYFLSTQ